MIRMWKWIKNNPNRSMFLVPIILVALISISHVVTWYDMANPINWAIYLSVAIEIAAMTALVAASTKIKSGIWFMFGLVTFIQVLGNVFYCYKEIDENGELFKSWVELTTPVWELLGTTDTIGLKRWLAFLEGGLLPIISLTSLHFFITYNKKNDNEEDNGEYFNNRNKHIEKIVSDREEKEYNPMTEHPQDIYYPPSKNEDRVKEEEIRKKYPANVEGSKEFNEVNEKSNVVDSVPEGKEFNVAYPITDEIIDKISEMGEIDTASDIDNSEDNELDEVTFDDISLDDEIIEKDDIVERSDDQIKKYLPDTEIEDKEEPELIIEEDTDTPEPPTEVKKPEEVKKEIIRKKIVKQPLKPPKTKIKRID
jgi:hypothetical protein